MTGIRDWILIGEFTDTMTYLPRLVLKQVQEPRKLFLNLSCVFGRYFHLNDFTFRYLHLRVRCLTLIRTRSSNSRDRPFKKPQTYGRSLKGNQCGIHLLSNFTSEQGTDEFPTSLNRGIRLLLTGHTPDVG